ncbi:MAG: TetR family transcriptional regulator [Burkholderiaceae bacterium]
MKAEMPTKTKRAEDNTKAKRRKSTASLIQQAILHLQAENAKVTISAVAKAANITPALIHNTYPDLAEQIRGINGKATRAQRDVKHVSLVKEREANRALRTENANLKEDVAKLASVNQKLLAEIVVLKGMASGKVVALLRHPADQPADES